MLELNRIDASEGIDVNKTDAIRQLWCLSLMIFFR